MKIIDVLETRIIEIREEVLLTIENQSLSLTAKNTKMQPLIEEKKVLEHALVYLEKIKTTNYKGLCGGGAS